MRRQDNSKTSTGGPPAADASRAVAATTTFGRRSAPRDGLVLFCIAIVSAAISMMLFTQFSLTLPASLFAGAVAWTTFMLIHRQVQKSAQIAQLKAELARARAQQGPKARPRVGVPLSVGAGAIASSDAPAISPQAMAEPADAGRAGGVRQDGPRVDLAPEPPLPRQAAIDATTANPPAGPSHSPVAPDDRMNLHMPKSSGPHPASPTPNAEGARSEAIGPRQEIMRDHWSFRPRAELQGSQQGSVDAPFARVETATTIEGSLELVQRKIKELADEVNANEASRLARPAREDGAAKTTADAIENSIGALKAAASNMRERASGDFTPSLPVSHEPESSPLLNGLGEFVIPSTAERIAGSEPVLHEEPAFDAGRAEPSLPGLPPIDFPLTHSHSSAALPSGAASVARAVKANAIDVYLGPIVTLSSHSVSHYEMTLALRAPDGMRIDPSEINAIADIAIVEDLDAARLERAAALASRMDARDREGSLLTDFTGSSFTSLAFLETFARVYGARPKLASQLVLTLSQRATDGFTPAAWQSVSDMHAFGFRFALDDIEHMGSDFVSLAQSGFRFVKLDAAAVVNGFAGRDRFHSGEEICQRITLAGLSIIATGIADVATQSRLLEYGVVFGEGPVFGAPRQVRLDLATAPSRSAA